MKKTAAAISALLIINFGMTSNVQAIDMGNMMNPSKWFGGNKDDDRHRDDRSHENMPPPSYGPPSGRGYYPPPQGRGYRPPQGQNYYPHQEQRYAQPGGRGSTQMPRSPEECAARIRQLEEHIRRLESTGASLPAAGAPQSFSPPR